MARIVANCKKDSHTYTPEWTVSLVSFQYIRYLCYVVLTTTNQLDVCVWVLCIENITPFHSTLTQTSTQTYQIKYMHCDSEAAHFVVMRKIQNKRQTVCKNARMNTSTHIYIHTYSQFTLVMFNLALRQFFSFISCSSQIVSLNNFFSFSCLSLLVVHVCVYASKIHQCMH